MRLLVWLYWLAVAALAHFCLLNQASESAGEIPAGAVAVDAE